MPAGRPTDYTPEMGELICERVAINRTVVAALDAEGMPEQSTFYRWLIKHPELRKNYEVALAYRAEADNEELRRVAYDLETPSDHKRAIIDVLKWQQSRANPKRYGEKIALTGGDENDSPIAVRLDGLTQAQREAIASARLEGE